MTDVKLNDITTITLYSSIKELPIELSKKFNNYLLQDAGIGNTIEDVDDHLARLMVFISEGEKAELLEEVKNLRYNLFSMLAKWDYEAMSFACLIKDVNGEPVTDYSSEGIIALMARLSEQGLNNEKVQTVIEEVKKNLIPNVNFTSLNSSEPI